MKKMIFSFGAIMLLASFNVQPAKTYLTGKEQIELKVKNGRGYTAQLSGAEEVGMGDPDGSGRVYMQINLGQGTIYFYLEVHDIETPTGAHIHLGAPGVSGPVVVGLEAPVAGLSYGTVNVDKVLLKDIKSNPEKYYVNVHNATYPAGAVRGQIEK